MIELKPEDHLRLEICAIKLLAEMPDEEFEHVKFFLGPELTRKFEEHRKELKEHVT